MLYSQHLLCVVDGKIDGKLDANLIEYQPNQEPTLQNAKWQPKKG